MGGGIGHVLPSSFQDQFSNSSKFEKKVFVGGRFLARSLLFHTVALYHIPLFFIISGY